MIRASAIITISMAIGIAGGASMTAIAQNQNNMRSALDHLVAADAFLAKAYDNKGGHCVKGALADRPCDHRSQSRIKFANRN